MLGLVGRIEGGAVHLDQKVTWGDGQRVLVIALPPDELVASGMPPTELLEEDARELAPRADLIARTNLDELD